MEQGELGTHLPGPGVVPTNKVWTPEKPFVQPGPVPLDPGGQPRAGRLHGLDEVLAVERLHFRRGSVGRDGPGERHQAGQVPLQGDDEGLRDLQEISPQQGCLHLNWALELDSFGDLFHDLLVLLQQWFSGSEHTGLLVTFELRIRLWFRLDGRLDVTGGIR